MGKGIGGRVVALIFLVVGLLLLVGAVGTWAKVGPFDVGGLDNTGGTWFTHGWLVLGCATLVLLASVLALAVPHAGWHILSAVASLVAGWVGLRDLLEMQDVPPQGGGLLPVQVGYGLVLTTFTGFLGVAVFGLACLNILMSPVRNR